MKSIDELRNEIANLNTDARRMIARDLLAAQSRRLDDSLIPLDANHKEVMKEEKAKRELAAVLCTAAAASVCALTVYCVIKGKKAIKRKAEEEKARIEEEKKALYRKLANLKGRA